MLTVVRILACHHTGVFNQQRAQVKEQAALQCLPTVALQTNCCLSVQNWVTEMAAYVKRIDPNHMLTGGGWGYKTKTPKRP